MSEQSPVRFEAFKNRAEALVGQPSRVKSLVADATRKMTRLGGGKFTEMSRQLTLALALVRAWVAGDYRQVSNKTMVILLAALLYFVVPIDVVPDFLFGWGLLDDAAVLGYVFGQLTDEIAAFQQWQDQSEEPS